MKTMDSIQVNLSNETLNSESVKQCILEILLEQDAIDEKQHIKYSREYGVVLIKKSWYKRLFDTSSDVEWLYKFVKLTDYDKQ